MPSQAFNCCNSEFQHVWVFIFALCGQCMKAYLKLLINPCGELSFNKLFAFLICKIQSCFQSYIILVKLKFIFDYLILWPCLVANEWLKHNLTAIALVKEQTNKKKEKKREWESVKKQKTKWERERKQIYLLYTRKLELRWLPDVNMGK